MGEYWEEHGGLGKVLEVVTDLLPSAMMGLWRSMALPTAGVDEGCSAVGRETAVEAWEAHKRLMVFMM